MNQNELKIKNFLNIFDISVIIPIYNSEKYLISCLQSIIMQSLKRIEIICIDDGSTDNSLKILEQYKKIDNRIIILKQENKGSALARNRGLNISKGKFIAFIDSDDLYPNMFTLEYMLKKAIQKKVLICGGGVIRFIQHNNSKKLIIKKRISFSFNRIIYYSNYQYNYYYQRFIYNKNFLKKNKLSFPNYLRFQDPPFFIKSMILAKKFFSLVNITYYYRLPIRPKIMNKRRVIDIYKGIRECLHIAESNKLYKLYYEILCNLNSKIAINGAKKYIKDIQLNTIISHIIKSINYKYLLKENVTFIKNSFYDLFLQN